MGLIKPTLVCGIDIFIACGFAIGEIVGAIAVIATLAYLATQVRESKKATLADVYQTRAHARGAAELQVALNSPTFHKAMFKFETGVAESGVELAVRALSDEERFLVRHYYHEAMMRVDNVHFQYQQGFLSEDYFETAERGMRGFVPIWEALGLDGVYPFYLKRHIQVGEPSQSP